MCKDRDAPNDGTHDRKHSQRMRLGPSWCRSDDVSQTIVYRPNAKKARTMSHEPRRRKIVPALTQLKRFCIGAVSSINQSA